MVFKLFDFISIIISWVQGTVIGDFFLIPPNNYRKKPQNILIACLDWTSGKDNALVLAFNEERLPF